MITKDRLAQLRAERIKHNARLQYDAPGPIKTIVVSTIEAEREREIMLGERAMQDALHDMRIEQALSSHKGLSQAHFNNPKQEIKP